MSSFLELLASINFSQIARCGRVTIKLYLQGRIGYEKLGNSKKIGELIDEKFNSGLTQEVSASTFYISPEKLQKNTISQVNFKIFSKIYRKITLSNIFDSCFYSCFQFIFSKVVGLPPTSLQKDVAHCTQVFYKKNAKILGVLIFRATT